MLEVPRDVLSLECGILDIARLHLLIERTVRELSERLSRAMFAWREEQRQDPEDQDDASDEEDKIQYLPVIIWWTTTIIAIASIVGALPSSRALIIVVTLVQMCHLSIHRLMHFLCDR